MKIRALLDTHALIWYSLSPNKLGAKAKRAIDNAAFGEIAFTSHSVVELGRLIDEGKVSITKRPSEWFAPLFVRFPILPASLDAAIAAPVLRLPHSDPYDRLIVAEAIALGVPLITIDGNITDSGIVRVIW